MRHRIGLIAVLAVLLVAACGDDDAGTTTTEATTTTAGATTTSGAPTTTAGAAGVTISATNFEFQPSTAELALGGTVTFSVTGGSHTLTAVDGSFDSGAVGEGSSFSFTPDAAGTFEFFCEFHPSMTGTLTVTG